MASANAIFIVANVPTKDSLPLRRLSESGCWYASSRPIVRYNKVVDSQLIIVRTESKNVSDNPQLKVDGQVDRPKVFSFEDLAAWPAERQVQDVSRFAPKRQGDAVRLSAILEAVQPSDAATHIGLHGTLDNFHASIPLAPVLESAFLIYRLNGQPLSVKDGGPFRFFIPDHAACHTDEIDECANVKFVDHIELTVGKGFDNRPTDDDEHAKLHQG